MKQSIGLLVFRRKGQKMEVLLTHPGGPFWAKKDVWSIPKGEVEEGEDPEQTLEREFEEETGFKVPAGERIDLSSAKRGGDKTNHIWAVEGNVDVSKFVCKSMFKLEWPPRSGQIQEFPENDRAAWFELSQAKQKVYSSQAIFFDRLAEHLAYDLPKSATQQRLL